MGRPNQLLVLSAKTETALNTAAANLAKYLKSHPDVNVADVAYTLQVGRRGFEYRRTLVCDDISQAINALETSDTTRVLTSRAEHVDRPVVMMFSGQGAQYVNMARGLYQHERRFREQVDRCSELLLPHLKLDLRNIIYHDQEQPELDQTFLAQPALFVIEYALAELWISWGVRPEAMIGHSVGEYVAACLAGVISLEDALMLVAVRGRLMQQLPTGAMLAVSLGEEDVRSLLDQNAKLSLAAVNAASLCVVSGEPDAVQDFAARCAAKGAHTRRLHTSHAFHSAMMEPMLDEFLNHVQKVKLSAPRIPYISNVTGQWITDKEATTPSYWTKHVRQTVRFADGINELSKHAGRVFLEVGPGHTLSTSVRQAQASLPGAPDKEADIRHLLTVLGKLWLAGARVDWERFKCDKRRRLPLPTYPFERQRYWISRANNGVMKQSESQISEQPTASSILRPSGSPPAESRSLYTAPRNQVEQTIAGVWQDVLGVSRLGIHDNFFGLGGNSLLGIQLVSMLRKAFLLELPMNSIFESQTVAEQAIVISETQRKESELEELDQMLKAIEELSAEDLESKLALLEQQSSEEVR
jgi:acyl transferase domain-containing protein